MEGGKSKDSGEKKVIREKDDSVGKAEGERRKYEE